MTALPLTTAQQGVWFAQQLDPNSTAFMTAERLELQGPVDDDALAAAIRAAVDEADVLHVRVADRDGVPWQHLEPPGDWPLQIVDLRGAPDPESAADDWCERALAHPVDLARDPLFSEALLRVADDRVLWFQRVHHLAVDAVGLQLIARRAADRYAALLAGEDPGPSPFPALDSVVQAEAEYRASAAATRDREYWEGRWSADLPPVAALSDRPLGPVRGVHRASVALPDSTLAALRAAADVAGASWPEVVIAAGGAYVHRLTGPPDGDDPHAVVLGVPLIGARRADRAARARHDGERRAAAHRCRRRHDRPRAHASGERRAAQDPPPSAPSRRGPAPRGRRARTRSSALRPARQRAAVRLRPALRRGDGDGAHARRGAGGRHRVQRLSPRRPAAPPGRRGQPRPPRRRRGRAARGALRRLPRDVRRRGAGRRRRRADRRARAHDARRARRDRRAGTRRPTRSRT